MRCLLLGFAAAEAAALVAAVTARRPEAVVSAISAAQLSALRSAEKDALLGHPGPAAVIKVDGLASASLAVTSLRSAFEGRLGAVVLVTDISLRPLLDYMDTWERLRFDELSAARRVSIVPNQATLFPQVADNIIYALEVDSP
jgi:hypothetical protein